MIRQACRRPPHPLLIGRYPRCHYHSYEHEKTAPFTPTEQAILSASLAHVPCLGFTLDALTQGTRDAGFSDISANLFPAGAFALVHHHLVTQRLALAAGQVEQELSIPLRIQRLARQRLHMNVPIIHKWQEALALMAAPSYVPASLRELALLSDEILFLAGDVSVDTSWYTRRLALSTVYASTEVFMTTDTSPNFTETDAFLSRRLNESNNVGSMMRDTGAWLGVQGMGVVNGLRSKGVRI